MSSVVFLLLVAVGMGAAVKDCKKEADDCAQTMLTAMTGRGNKEEVCEKLRNSELCSVAIEPDCYSDDLANLIISLRELKEILQTACSNEGFDGGDRRRRRRIDEFEEEEVSKCLQENEDYMYDCITQAPSGALAILQEHGGVPEDKAEDAMICTIYKVMTSCFVGKIEEKCGEDIRQIASEKLADIPNEIKQACKSASLSSLNVKKKPVPEGPYKKKRNVFQFRAKRYSPSTGPYKTKRSATRAIPFITKRFAAEAGPYKSKRNDAPVVPLLTKRFAAKAGPYKSKRNAAPATLLIRKRFAGVAVPLIEKRYAAESVPNKSKIRVFEGDFRNPLKSG